MGNSYKEEAVVRWGVFILYTGIAFGGLLFAFQSVKRLHDLDRPGKHFWLFLIPFYNVYFGFFLLFKKGSEDFNQYG